MLQFVLTSLFVSFGTSVLCVPLIRGLAPTLGLVDHPGHRKVHATPTPLGGGIAVALGIFVPVLLLWLLPNVATDLSTGFTSALERLSEDNQVRRQMTAILAGATVLFLVGLADDCWDLPWVFRLVTQLSVAVGVTWMGVRATVFVEQPWIGFVVTVIWVVVLTNAMNFLDNMDALSAGISFIACVLFAGILLVFAQTPNWVVAFGLLIAAGSLGGFLCWNRPPASIFMGDCGSNLAGFLLATLTVAGTFYHESGSRHVILAPLCVLAIPLYDFCTVILIRLRQGRSPFHGDKSHFSHRLVDLGLKPAHAVLTIHLATLMTGLGGLLLYKVSDWTGTWLVVAMICCVLAVVAILETVGRQSSLRSARELAASSDSSTAPEQSRSASGPSAIPETTRSGDS